jgi:hypothetical protein
MMRISIWQAVELFRRHPSDRMLIALHDGQISEGRSARLRRHLDKCPTCRTRSSQIQCDWDLLAKVNSAENRILSIAEQALVSRVHDSIRDWKTEHPDWTDTEHRMEHVLGVYLGKRAAAALVQGSNALQDPGQDHLASAGSTLRILLGKKSAVAIESTLLRIMGQASESTSESSS